MADFPPVDISGFLQLNAGDWLALRSLLLPEQGFALREKLQHDGERSMSSQPWHDSERSELRVTLLEPTSEIDWGGVEIVHSGESKVRLVFHKDGFVAFDSRLGHWHLGEDGSLELAVREEHRTLKERVWFRKPNLRLRCTLEQFSDGRPGRASFSSEIRRVPRPPEAHPPGPGPLGIHAH